MHIRFRAHLLATSIFVSIFTVISEPAVAQDAAASDGDTIVVTGTRIRQPELEFSNPIVAVTKEQIDNSGATNIGTFLKDLPALTASQDSHASAGSNDANGIGMSGLNLLDLRSLGYDRTLVLVNGRRHIAALPGSAAVDTNTIPLDLVDRVDVLTGGASAIYGADGVSGVVNFVMKDNFEGFRMRVQGGKPEFGGGAKDGLFAVTGGKNFADDRGNVAASFEYSHEGRLAATSRPTPYSFVRNPDDPFDDPNIPDRVPLRDIRYYESSPLGAVYTDVDDYNGLLGIDPNAVVEANFNGDGRGWNAGTVPFIPPFYAQGGDATPIDGYQGDLLPKIDRYNFNVFGHYDFSEHAKFYSELKYVHTHSFTLSQPTFDYYLAIAADNPFMPASIANAINASQQGAGDFDTGNGTSLPVALTSRDSFDLGRRGEDIDRDTYRAVVGFEGAITDGLDYNVSYTFGQTVVKNHVLRERLDDRWAAAIDVGVNPATGLADCKVNYLAGYTPINVDWNPFPAPTTFAPGECVPFNIFADNSGNEAAKDWIAPTGFSRTELTQHVFNAYLSGNLDRFFKLPGGSIGWSAGAEYREEDSEGGQTYADLNGLGFGGSTILENAGSYDVMEFFAEARAPLLADLPFIKELTIDGAIRQSDYSTIGSTTTWKVGGEYAPIADISFRGTYAEAVRAPNVGELFDPGGQTFLFIEDPCDSSRLNLGTQYRAANCAAILSGLGVANPGAFTDPNTTNIRGLQTGNRDLEEETAKTFTVGAILQPSFMQGFTLSLDYYDIKLSNAINILDPQDLANQCVDLPTIVNQFCDALTRTTGTAQDPAGAIVDFLIQPVNVASYRTKGVDFTVNYVLDPENFGAESDWGIFNFRLVGNHLHELSYVNLVGADPDPQKGELQKPEWQGNLDVTWVKGPVTLNYGVNYFSATQRYTLQEIAGEPDIADGQYLKYSEKFTHDIQARWNVDDHYEIYAGVDNFTDQRPDIGESFYPVSAVGRFFYIGATASFDSLGAMLSNK